MPGPLEGIRILDFTRFQQGTFGTLLLADLGADVLKVEQPGGDPGRTLGKHVDGYSSYFESLNRNKRSLCLDLSQPEGREVVKRLAATVDAVTENFRPGTMEKLGIGYDVLSAINPGLVFASGSMFGPKGPRGHDPGYDTIAQAAGGIMMWSLRPGETPTGIQGGLADQTGGAMLGHAVLAALVHKLRTGEGQKVDVSLYGSQIAIQGIHVARMLHHAPLKPPGQSSGVLSHRAQCLDGRWIAFGFLESRHFPKLCRGLELDDLIDDPDYATGPARGQNHGRLVELIDARVITRPAAEWVERLRQADVPCTIIQDYEMIAADEQARANGYIHEEEHPVWGRVVTQGPVAQLSKTPASVRRSAPLHPGQDSEEILAESGFAPAEIDALLAAGVVQCPERQPATAGTAAAPRSPA
jgi:crotonobetainyl-CoA:carnitine CoA-transferase CaiB-like acyl-CoA transferase